MLERGADLIKRSGFEKALDAYGQIKNELYQFIENNSKDVTRRESPYTWTRNRALFMYDHGEQSVAAILPEKIERNSRFLTSTIRTLLRSGIYTKEDLIFSDIEELSNSSRNIGEKTKELVIRMQNVALAEQYIEWNSHNK